MGRKGKDEDMALIGNILWFLLGGVWLGLEWVLAGVLFCCTIIGIPFGIGCFRIAKVSFAPLGKKVVSL